MREADNLGSNLDYGKGVYMILNSLPEIFKGFLDYYLTTKVEIEVRLLADELEINVKLNNFGDDKVKVGKTSSHEIKRSLEKSESSEPHKTKRKRLKKNAGKCFHCNVDGYWKCNYPKYLAELAEKKRQNDKSDLHILDAMLVEVNTPTWIIDSGTTSHICSSLQLLRSFTVNLIWMF